MNHSRGFTLVEVMIGIAILVIAMYFLTQLIYNISTTQAEVRDKLNALLECEAVAESIIIYPGTNAQLESEYHSSQEVNIEYPDPDNAEIVKVTVTKTFRAYNNPDKSYDVSLSFLKFDPVE